MRKAKPSAFSPHDMTWHRIDDSCETLAARLANTHTSVVLLSGSSVSAQSPWDFFNTLFWTLLFSSLFIGVMLGALLALVIPRSWMEVSLFECWVVVFIGLLAWVAVRGRAWHGFKHRHDQVRTESLELNLEKRALIRTISFKHRPERSEVISLKFAQLRAVYRYHDSGADDDACQPSASVHLEPKVYNAAWHLNVIICSVACASDEAGRKVLAPLIQALVARTGIQAG